MFNYECYKQKGTVLGTCIDGFLFGACCRLPSKDNDILENIIVIDKMEKTSENPPVSSTYHHKFTPPTFLSDILESRTSTPASAEDSVKTNTSQNNNNVEHSASESSIFIDNLDMQLPIKQPSIILGNGSVVSLESISIKPELYELISEKPSSPPPDRNQLFTWFAIDQLMNSTTSKDSPSKQTTTTTTTTSL